MSWMDSSDIGIILLLLSEQSRKKRNISEGPLESGIYAFIRHPEFLSHMLIISALVLITQYLVSLVVGILLITLLYLAIVEEKKRNIEKFGNAYKNYM